MLVLLLLLCNISLEQPGLSPGEACFSFFPPGKTGIYFTCSVPDFYFTSVCSSSPNTEF